MGASESAIITQLASDQAQLPAGSGEHCRRPLPLFSGALVSHGGFEVTVMMFTFKTGARSLGTLNMR